MTSGATGGMMLEKVDFMQESPSMNGAINYAKQDGSNSTYTDYIVFKTDKKTDNKIYESAVKLQADLKNGDEKYHVFTNNCADAVESVIEKGTGVDLPSGISPSPNTNFGNIKNNQKEIQEELNKNK